MAWYILLYGLYIVAAFAGRALTRGEYPFTPIWFAGAVYIIALLSVPYKSWWRVIICTALAHYTYTVVGPGEIQIRVLFYLGRTIEALAGAVLFRRFVNSENRISSTNQSIRLVFTCMGCTVLSAAIGSYTVSRFVPAGSMKLYFPVWWSGNTLGLLAILPLYFIQEDEFKHIISSVSRIAEAVLLFTAFSLLAVFSFYSPHLRVAVGNLLIFPLLFYVAYRFRTLGLSLFTLFLLFISAYGKVVWPDFFMHKVAHNELEYANALIHLAIYYLSLFLFIAMVKEREGSIAKLQLSEEKFRLLTENSLDVIYKLQVVPSFSLDYVSPSITILTGYNFQEIKKAPFKVFTKLFTFEKARLAEIFTTPEVLKKRIVLKWRTKTGDTIWVEQRGWPITDNEGRIIAIEGSVRDITEAKEVELIALRNEQRLQRAETIAHLGSWEYQLNTGSVFWTRQLTVLLGFTEKTPTTMKSIFDCVPFSYRAFAVHAFEALKADFRPYAIEHPLLKQTGEEIWVESRAEAIFDENHNCTGLIGSLLDITQRIIKEQEFSRQNTFLNTIFDSSPYIILLINKDGKIIKANKGAEKFSGTAIEHKNSELLGEVIRCVHAFPVGSCGNTEECKTCLINVHLKNAFANRAMVNNLEGTLEVTRGGKQEAVRVLISTVLLHHEEDLVLLSIADISAQRIAEERLKESEMRSRFIVDNIADVVWTCTPDLIYTYVNKADALQRGYKDHEVIGTSILDQVVEKYRPMVQERYAEVLKQVASGRRDEKIILEYEQFCKNGDTTWTEIIATPVFSEENQFHGFQGIAREVNARRAMFEKTFAQAELYQQMFAKHSAIQLLIDAHSFTILDANNAAVQYYGYTLEQFKSMNVSKLQARPAATEHSEAANLFLRYSVFKHQLASGEVRDVEVYTSELLVGAKQVLYAIVHDITDRVLTAKKLSMSEKKYKEIFEQSVDIIYLINLQGVFLSISPAVTGILGYQPVELIGRNLKEFLTPASFDVSYRELIKKTSETNADIISKYTVEIIAKDGTIKNFEINSKLYRDDPENLSILGTARDVSDRKKFESILMENESRFKSIWNQSVDGMRIIDEAGEILLVNDAFCKLVERHRENLVGKPFSVIYKDGDNEHMVLTGQSPMYVHFRERVDEDAIEKIMERQVALWNGKILWFEISNSIIKREGNKQQILSIFRDISERKRTSFELEKANQDLQEHIQTKNRFLSIISHDLRGPFHGFLGVSKLLRDQLDTLSHEEISEIASELHRSLSNQYDLLSELLEWSKLQTGRMEFKPVPVAVKEEVKVVYNQFLPLIALKQILVSILINENYKIHCDVHMLRLLIRNVLSNAIKFSHASGSIQIKVEESSEYTSLIIEDDGIGIPEDVRVELFNLNYSTSREGTAGEKGTGIGLVLCKEIMLRHGGDIFIHSTVGEGTKIILRFPLPVASAE